MVTMNALNKTISLLIGVCTGDGCRRDEDGYYWITSRVDDVLNVPGHRLGAAGIKCLGGS